MCSLIQHQNKDILIDEDKMRIIGFIVHKITWIVRLFRMDWYHPVFKRSQRSWVKLFCTQPVFHLAVIQPLCWRAWLRPLWSHCYGHVSKEHSWKNRSVKSSRYRTAHFLCLGMQPAVLVGGWARLRVQRPHPVTPHRRKIWRRRRRRGSRCCR